MICFESKQGRQFPGRAPFRIVWLGMLLALAPATVAATWRRGSGWPVALVELRTVHGVRFVTDSAGLVAFDLPELMGRPDATDQDSIPPSCLRIADVDSLGTAQSSLEGSAPGQLATARDAA